MSESFGEVIEYEEELVVTSVLHPEAGQFVGPGVKVKLYDPVMAAEGTPTTKEWLDNEYVVLTSAEARGRRENWDSGTSCPVKRL